MTTKNLFLAVTICLISFNSVQGGIFNKKKKENAPITKKADINSDNGLSAYNKVITKDAKTGKGFIKVHRIKSKYYFQIPDSILGRDILIVNRISKAPVSPSKFTVGYPGDKIGENVIRFEKAPENKIYIRSVSYLEQAKDTAGMYQSVKNSNIQPIVAAFDIKTYYTSDSIKGKHEAVIDITDYLKGDNEIFCFDPQRKKKGGIGNIFVEKGYIDTIKTFPINTEIRTTKTFAQVPPYGYPADKAAYYPSNPLTYELNSSMLLLPKEPMKARLFDPRVGFFAVRYVDFDSNPQGIENKAKITRWRLEPKDEDLQKYLNGELVEPKKPIVIYIDPATPRKWVPYLIKGVNDWQKSFEKAGFKNAIYALEAPNDSTWSLEDARHSAIVYKPSTISNASGPHVHDPRSGEIIETHINWYHNVMALLRNWYMIQASPNDKRARSVLFDDELMGELIRFVSSHEVGHTLGLRHNFGSSATIPVEKLRDKAWVEANGHTPSIMDYARFNYVAQPEDNISEQGIFPRIGIYDDWAIEWGYRYLPQFASAEDEIPNSNKTIIEKLQADKRYTFGRENDDDDPRNQSEDLGDNAMLASAYGIKNLRRIVPNILQWTREDNNGYEKASLIYTEVVGQYGRYMGHVTKNIAGIYHTPITVEQTGKSTEFVPSNIQKEAVLFLNDNLFTTPEWLIDKTLIEKANADPITAIGGVQRRILDRLINKNTLDKMQQNEAYNGTAAYTSKQLFNDLRKGVWAELYNGKDIDVYRRNMQREYVENLIEIIKQSPANLANLLNKVPLPIPSDATSTARMELEELRKSIKSALPGASGAKRTHLIDILAQIDTSLDTGKK